MSELGSVTKVTGANFSAHRIASVAPTTFAQVFGVAAPAVKPPIADIGQYIPLKSDVFTRSSNNVRFSGQSVQAQFAEFARSARLARFSGLGVTKNMAPVDGHHALLYQFASAQTKSTEQNPTMAALRVTQPAFGNGPIAMDVVTYRHASHLNQKLTLNNSALLALPRLEYGAAVPTAPNLVRFGDEKVLPVDAVALTIHQPQAGVQAFVDSLGAWGGKVPSALKPLVKWVHSTTTTFLKNFNLGPVRFPLGSATAVLAGQKSPQVVQPVVAMRFGNNVVEIINHGPAATAQTFASLKEASVGISAMANHLEQTHGLSRLADKTVSHFAAASNAGVANPYAKSPFARNPFASVAFAGGSKPPPIRPVEATVT
ncbi:MAG: hypothetical protein QE263_07980 [Vampirovibrionales bacterium]|nr:hypothetical protein [Vampirovibrionales bacterium]